MIKHIQRGCLLVTAWLLFSHSLWADDSKIAAWAGQVLISTLSVNYMESDEDLNQMRAYYTLDAWNGISFFLGNYLDKVRAQKLTLHPIATRPPTITNKGRIDAKNLFPSMPYWRVYQPILLPELKLNITFSMLVVCPESGQAKCLIQSISMVKN